MAESAAIYLLSADRLDPLRWTRLDPQMQPVAREGGEGRGRDPEKAILPSFSLTWPSPLMRERPSPPPHVDPREEGKHLQYEGGDQAEESFAEDVFIGRTITLQRSNSGIQVAN